MKQFLFCLLLLNTTLLWSTSLQWYDGVIVLQNHQVLVGKLRVEQLCDVVLFHHPDSLQVTVFPAFRINAVNYFDALNNINRRFISWQQQNTVKATQLYEVVVTGKVWVLRRLNTYHSTPPHDDEYTYYSKTKDELVELKKFGAAVYTQLDNLSGRQLSVYARSRRFDPYLPADAIQIIQYFNSLEIPEAVLSRK